MDLTRAITALAQEAPDGVTFERGLLALLDRAVGFDVAFIDTKTVARAPTLVGLDAGHLHATPAVRATYDRELAPVRDLALATRGVAVDTDVLGVSAVRASTYHRDLAAPVRGKHSLLAYAVVRGRELGGLMLGRTGGAFRAAEIAVVEEALPTIALALASYAHDAPAVPAADEGLTPRERDVLGYVCLGYTNAEIARACGSSPNTVRNQLARVFRKLGASTRAEAVGLALGGGAPRRAGGRARTE
jgi:DNA-binding CsgD family transcriptional regulator